MYRISKNDLNNCWKTSYDVKSITGKSFVIHFFDSLWCILRYGCYPSQYIDNQFYKMKSYERDKTYTKGRGYRIAGIFNLSRHICQDKVEFNQYFKKYIHRDWLYLKDASIDEVNKFINGHDRLIIKPIDAAKGKGVCELNKNDDLSCLQGKNCLLEEMIVQHKDMCFENNSVNTIRCVSVMDKLGEIHILKAVLRAGVGSSIVDNVCAGGDAYPINILYGKIEGSGRRKGEKHESGVFVHPGTDIFMLGRCIPYWNEVLSLVKDAAKMLPDCRFIGWDIAVTDHGPELIEGNTRTDAHLLEYIGEKRGFYKEIMSYR